MTVRILRGDCCDVLRTLPDASVHCCVTSPPYYGLRDYDVPPTEWPEVVFVPMAGIPAMTVPAMKCCHGLEPDPWSFIAHEVCLFREVRRVLRADGTLWLNIGDSYVGARGGAQGQSGQCADRSAAAQNVRFRSADRLADGCKPKDLLGIPWMLAFALRADGWYLRQDIIWSKPNTMPESVRDRCTKAHEYLFLLSKSQRYYFDAESIADARASIGGSGVAGWASGDTPHNAVAHNRDKGNARTFRGGQYTNGAKFDNSHKTARDSTGNVPSESDLRNKRSVWNVATQPFKDAHFATFPPALIEPCMLAGSPQGGVVIDPFGGSGTTGLVADRLQRNAILIELNPSYADMARQRITAEAPFLSEVTIEAIA